MITLGLETCSCGKKNLLHRKERAILGVRHFPGYPQEPPNKYHGRGWVPSCSPLQPKYSYINTPGDSQEWKQGGALILQTSEFAERLIAAQRTGAKAIFSISQTGENLGSHARRANHTIGAGSPKPPPHGWDPQRGAHTRAFLRRGVPPTTGYTNGGCDRVASRGTNTRTQGLKQDNRGGMIKSTP